jgi:hypothetical protein
MERLEAAGQKDCGPNEITYSRVMMAWLNNKHPDADGEVAALDKEMKSMAEKTRRKDRKRCLLHFVGSN